MRMICFILQGAPQVAKTHEAADEFVKMDPSGVGLAVIAMTVVFVVLTIIYLIFKNISIFYAAQSARKATKAEKKASKEVTAADKEINSEISAAIAMAIHLYYNQQHDMESMKLTIQKVSRMYSPWSSKIYSLRQLPRY